jgi:hypothetical protein
MTERALCVEVRLKTNWFINTVIPPTSVQALEK